MRNKTSCPAAGLLDIANDKVTLTCPTHNDDSHCHEKQIRVLKNKLKEHAKNWWKTTREDFDDVCRNIPMEISATVSFPQVQRTMFKAKSERYPRSPQSIDEFHNLQRGSIFSENFK